MGNAGKVVNHSSSGKIAQKKLQQNSEDANMNAVTNVTFSEELSHPIPSVSRENQIRQMNSTPIMERENQIRQINTTPIIDTQASSIFNDLDDFTFHSTLAGSSDQITSMKTPEKLLTSVPLAAVITDKKSSIRFDNFADFGGNKPATTDAAVTDTEDDICYSDKRLLVGERNGGENMEEENLVEAFNM